MKKIITLTSLLVISTTANAALINGNFEDPNLTPETADFASIDALPGWKTTDTKFELWSDGFRGTPAFEGNQHVELVDFGFAHRGREGDTSVGNFLDDVDFGVDITAVPVPASAWLFVAGLLGMISIARRKNVA